jgi:NitT/TauT family transport system substrate-binding protein
VDSPLSGLPAMGAFLTREKDIKKRPEVVGGFLRALFKSYVWAEANPEAAVRLHWKQFPLQKPKGVSEEQALADGIAMVKARLGLLLPQKPNDPIGYVQSDLVERTAMLLHDNGILKQKPEVDKLVDQSLSKFANDFKRDDIVARAKAWKMD